MVQKNSKKSRPLKQANPSPAQKKSSAPSASSATGASDLSNTQDNDSVKHQQRLLNIFSEAFSSVLSSEQFPAVLQEIKQALFNREFGTAFGREDYIEAYAARWSPTRALCYASVLGKLEEYLGEVSYDQDLNSEVEAKGAEKEDKTSDPTRTADEPKNLGSYEDEPAVPPSKRINMLSIGGCAAEHVAFASHLQQTSCSGNLTLVDSGPWSHVSSLIQTQLTTPPTISKYASAAIKASNVALVSPQQLHMEFSQQDVLNLDTQEIAKLAGDRPLLVSILFTLNELYTSGGIGKTTKFLNNLGQSLPGGSLLLVLDSPGSYSEAAVGKEQKKYPMHWLLDHTLLKEDTVGIKWEKLESHDSIWFRLPDGLTYPMQLENMRYQMHLYRIERKS